MQRFKNILFVAEADADNTAALNRAVALAINNQASLTVIGVLTELPDASKMAITAITPRELMDSAVADRHDGLKELVKAAIPDDGQQCIVKVFVGRAFIEIIKEVLRNQHDLVIKPVEEHGRIRKTLFGSSDMHLLRKCSCPVWIVKSSDHEHYRRILAAVDHDPDDAEENALNRRILEMSTSLAIAESSELHVIHVWKLDHEHLLRSPRTGYSDADVNWLVQQEKNNRERWLDDLVQTFGRPDNDDAGDYLAPRLHLVKGAARHEVPTIARELDVELIVLGTVGRAGIPGLLIGNTAEEILTEIDCSVLAIKPPGFVSPVSLP